MKSIFSRMWEYLSFRKSKYEGGVNPTFNLRTMHTINKISIIMFVIGLTILMLKWFVF